MTKRSPNERPAEGCLLSFQFQRIHIEITNSCNLKCSFCPEIQRPSHSVSIEDFRQILKKTKPHAQTICLHLMGEPLSHPEFEEILLECERQNQPVDIVTNAILLNKRKDSLMNSPVLRQINFSLQSFFDNFPKKDHQLYLSNVLNFAAGLNPDVFVNYRFWDGNIEANKVLIKQIQNFYNQHYSFSADVKTKKSYLLSGKHFLHFDSRFQWPSFQAPFQSGQGFCLALINHIGVLSDGSVVPCCLDSQGQLVLGNLFQQDLPSILNSPRAIKIRQGFAKFQRTEKLCQHCEYSSRFSLKTRNRVYTP